jgi:phospholipid/cholesterol/gamma-HCH transport system substrate-binding protein
MQDKYRQDLTIEVFVGFFMFIILIALGVFTIVLSRQNFLTESWPVEVVFEEVGGLREGDHVFLRGTKVGTVKATMLENNHVVVRTDVTVPVEFREGYKIEVMASSMLGGKILKLYEGPLSAPPLPEDAVLRGEDPADILKELSAAVASIKAITDQVSSGGGTLGKLIRDEDVYNDLKETMANLNGISHDLANGDGTIGKLLKDDSVFNNLQNSVTNLSVVSSRLVNGQGTLGKLLSEDDELYNDLSASMSNVRNITGKIDAGEGTLGRLVSDDQIYHEAQRLLEEVRAAIDDMRETSPVTTFSTILFGAF